jgi:predicted acyltransferase
MTTPAEAATTGPVSLARTTAAADSELANQAMDYTPGILARPELPVQPALGTRLRSLDVFRGITIAAMILVNNMGDPKYAPFEHVEWHGWTPTDLIFPFFLFIVGVAMPFSFAKRSASSERSKGQLVARVWLRALSLWMLGQLIFAFQTPLDHALPDASWGYKTLRVVCFVFIYASMIALLVPWKSKRLQMLIPPIVAVGFYALMIGMHYATPPSLVGKAGGGIFNPDSLRIPGVLQRIGLVYGVAGTIAVFAGWRTTAAAIVALCALYSVVMLKVPYGPQHTAGSLEFNDNLARYVDEKVFDRYTLNDKGERVYTQRHAYRAYPDNEGLLSSIPAVATCLLGLLVGLWLRTGRTAIERCAGLLAMGVPVVVLGYLLNWWLIPINKILWTPSYVIFTGGLAMLGLGFLFWVIDVAGYRRWSWPAVVFGMNAIAAYVASSILPRLMNLIKFTEPGSGSKVGLYAFLHHQYSAGLQYLSHSMPVLAKPENVSLANALLLVLLVWLVMLVLYVFKIFLKV